MGHYEFYHSEKQIDLIPIKVNDTIVQWHWNIIVAFGTREKT